MLRSLLGFCCLGAFGSFAYFCFELWHVETVMQQISARIGAVGTGLIIVCCLGFTASIDPANDS